MAKAKTDPVLMKAFDLALGAVARQHAEELRLAIRDPQVLAMRDPEQRTLLLNACLPIAQRVSVEIVNILVDAGSDVQARDYAGYSALHGLVASEMHCGSQPFSDVARVLMSRGLSIDALDKYGNTPLWRAVFDWKPRVGFSTIDSLVEMGANPGLKNFSDKSPIDMLYELVSKVELRRHLREKWPHLFVREEES